MSYNLRSRPFSLSMVLRQPPGILSSPSDETKKQIEQFADDRAMERRLFLRSEALAADALCHLQCESCQTKK